jgi:hypothetical protein
MVLLAGFWSPSPAAAQAPDYSAGVKKLVELGLPDTRQAKYIKIEGSLGMWDLGYTRGSGPQLTGNAWLLETKTNGTGVVLLNQVRVTEILPAKLHEQQTQARMEALAARLAADVPLDEEGLADVEFDEGDLELFAGLEGPRVGEWKEADLKADLQGLITYLDKAAAGEEWELKSSAAIYFLFAAHAHQRGHSAEANRIMALLFQKAGDSRQVLSAAMSQIADAEYAKVYQAFAKSGHWAEYLAAMEGLLGRFAKAWRNAPVVERVAGMVRKHLERKTAPPVAAAGLSEEDLRIADLLGRTNTVIPPYHEVFNGLSWLARATETVRPRAKQPKTPGPLDLIQQRGTRAIPLLIALLKDDWLVRTTGAAASFYSFPDFDDETPDDDALTQRLEHFARPLSRGEIARRILEPLVTEQREVDLTELENKPSAEDLAQRSRAWYDKHSTTNRAELLRQLLAEGREEALGWLMSSQDAADRAAVESYLLNPNKLAEHLPQVTQYAQQHGAAARPFVQKYVAELKKLPSLVPKQELMHADARYLKQREEQARSALKNLEDMISDKTAEQMLQELVRAEKPWAEQELYKLNTVLMGKLAQEDPDKALTLLLQTCLLTTDDALARLLVQSAGQLKWLHLRQPKAQGAAPLAPRAFTVATHAALWKQVLAQERRSRPAWGWGGDAMSFQAQVAAALEGLYADPKNPRSTGGMASSQYLGARLYEITLQRAHARLAGKPEAELPAYPDKSKVSQERAAQITELLRQSTAETQHEIAGRLTLDELLALPDLVSADPKLNEKLVPGSHRIQCVTLGFTNETLAPLGQSLKGAALDRKTLETLIAACRKLAEQGSNVTAAVERRVPLAGVSLSVRAAPPAAGARSGASRMRSGPQASLILYLQSSGPDGLSASVQWPLKLAAASGPTPSGAGQAKPADDDLLPASQAGMAAYQKRQEEEFWGAFQKVFAPDRNACQPYTVTLAIQRWDSTEEE